jgi:hypothetical protein
MEKIRELLGRPVVTLVLGFVVGLIIGLPILGWWLWPVQYINAAPVNLRPDLQADYLRMAVDSYARNHDAQLAATRYQDLGKDGSAALAQLQNDPNVKPQDLSNFTAAISAPSSTTPQAAPSGQAPQETPGVAQTSVPTLSPLAILTPTVTAPGGRTGLNPVVLFVVFCLLTLIIGGALVYVLLLRKRVSKGEPSPASQAQELNRTATKTDFAAQGQENPIAQFMTTYMQGDDLYDDSFSIDSPSGEFLGECGVGISDTIGVGDPKKVTAFEVWLFDKNDIQTVTKVLMSEHAFNDPNIRQKLASKGEPMLVEGEKHLILETATLQLEARVVDINYGQGALPENSYFERLTLELAVWPKQKA